MGSKHCTNKFTIIGRPLLHLMLKFILNKSFCSLAWKIKCVTPKSRAWPGSGSIRPLRAKWSHYRYCCNSLKLLFSLPMVLPYLYIPHNSLSHVNSSPDFCPPNTSHLSLCDMLLYFLNFPTMCFTKPHMLQAVL